MGHFALGYIFSKASAKFTKTNLNLPVILTLSVLPDIDILLHMLLPFIEHRGPLHSIIIALIVFIPIFFVYRKTASPYFIALIQHSLISDYIAGGKVQLLWPLTLQSYGIGVRIESTTNITMEWLAFLTSALIMLKTKEIITLLKPKKFNLILAIPTFTVLLPTFLSFPLDVPKALVPPHILYLMLFLTSLLIDIKIVVKQSKVKMPPKPEGKGFHNVQKRQPSCAPLNSPSSIRSPSRSET